MILIAVIVGYTLGVMPFIIPKLLEKREKQIEMKENKEQYKSQEEILDEWLNGPKSNNKEETEAQIVDQEDIFKEYMTGITSPKGE